MAEVGKAFQGEIWYFVQDDYATCPTDGATTYPISCKVLDARIGTGDKHEEIRGIDSPCACNLHKLANDFTFHLEYHPQCDDTLIEKLVDRKATCEPDILAFWLGTNQCVAADADKSAFLLCGCVRKNVSISAAFNEYYTVSVDFSVKSIITDGDAAYPAGADVNGVGTKPAALSGAYLGFNVGGSIQKDSADIAYILDSFEVTWDFDVQDKYDHDSLDKQYALDGEIKVEGSCDISLDEGGGMHWAEVINQTAFQIVVDMGGATCPRITLPNCQWKSSEIDVNISSEPMMESAPFTCKPASACTDGFISGTPPA